MAKLIELAEQLLATSLRNNLYNSTSTYKTNPQGPLAFTEGGPKRPQSTLPADIHTTDYPKSNLSFDNIDVKPWPHPHGGLESPIPNPQSALPTKMHTTNYPKSNLSFEGKGTPHPHGGLIGRDGPISGIHDELGDFTNANNGRIKETKRKSLYKDTPPLSVNQQSNAIKTDSFSPNPGKKLPRDEIYKTKDGIPGLIDFHESRTHDSHKNSKIIPNQQSIPPQNIHDTLGDFMQENGRTIIEEKRRSFYEGSPPARPSDVNTKPLQGQINRTNTTDGYSLGNIYGDEPANLLGGGRYTNFINPTPAGLQYFDVFAVANWLRNISREFGILPRQHNNPITGEGTIERNATAITKGLTWTASQFYLASLNPGSPEYGGVANQTWNPLSLPASAIPGARPDNGVGVTVRAADASGLLGLGSSTLQFEKQSVDAVVRRSLIFQPEETQIPPSPALHQITPFIDASSDRVFDGSLISYSSTPNTLHARFLGQSVHEEEGVFDTPLSEDETYVPLMFQDLRDQPAKYMYFRAFIKEGLSENFTPEWQVRKYYGRVEGIPTYTHTTRTISLAFDVVAFGPADLPVIWKKLHKLQSMVYPAFNTEGYLHSAPMIRLRVGDLIATTNSQGLPGYINSLNFSYDDGIWTVEADWKVPRKITVSVNFTTLHDANVGVLIQSDGANNKFGTISPSENQTDGTTQYSVDETNIRKVMESVNNYYRFALKDGLGFPN